MRPVIVLLIAAFVWKSFAGAALGQLPVSVLRRAAPVARAAEAKHGGSVNPRESGANADSGPGTGGSTTAVGDDLSR